MTKNTYDQLEFALREKGFWTPADERRLAKDAKMEILNGGNNCMDPEITRNPITPKSKSRKVYDADTMQAQAAPRYFPITACYECPNRTEMHLLYKPYGMMVLPEGKELFDFMRRWVCSGKDDTEITGDNIPRWCPLSQHSTIAAQARKEGYAEGAAAEKREGSIKASKAYQAGIEVGTIEGAAAERERVVTFIRDFIASHIPEGSCPFDKMNSDECLNVRDGQCEVCIIDHAIDELKKERV